MNKIKLISSYIKEALLTDKMVGSMKQHYIGIVNKTIINTEKQVHEKFNELKRSYMVEVKTIEAIFDKVEKNPNDKKEIEDLIDKIRYSELLEHSIGLEVKIENEELKGMLKDLIRMTK